MDSAEDDRIAPARFPDSEIPGSKPTCRLPEAYRRQATSFFASWRQGIHRAPLVAWLLPTRLRLVVSIDSNHNRLGLLLWTFNLDFQFSMILSNVIETEFAAVYIFTQNVRNVLFSVVFKERLSENQM